jgi:hypothetical protein
MGRSIMNSENIKTETIYIKVFYTIKLKEFSFCKIESSGISGIYKIELNWLLFNRLRKINKITNTKNKDIDYIEKILKYKISKKEFISEEIKKYESKIDDYYIYDNKSDNKFKYEVKYSIFGNGVYDAPTWEKWE